jgi:hypothetical protein
MDVTWLKPFGQNPSVPTRPAKTQGKRGTKTVAGNRKLVSRIRHTLNSKNTLNIISIFCIVWPVNPFQFENVSQGSKKVGDHWSETYNILDWNFYYHLFYLLF